MSDSIENDVEFMNLVKAREKLEREISAVYSYTMLLGEYNDDRRLHNLQREASRARKDTYKYIDRYAERKVLEEREFQKHENFIKGLAKENSTSYRLYVKYIDSCNLAVHGLGEMIKKEIIKNIPLIFHFPHKMSVIGQKDRDLVMSLKFEIRGSWEVVRLKLSPIDEYIDVNPYVVAQYFSDEVNKIAREKYANAPE